MLKKWHFYPILVTDYLSKKEEPAILFMVTKFQGKHKHINGILPFSPQPYFKRIYCILLRRVIWRVSQVTESAKWEEQQVHSLQRLQLQKPGVPYEKNSKQIACDD
jgi:hypothetical protein